MTASRLTTALAIAAAIAGVGYGVWWLIAHPPAAPKVEKPTPPAAVAKVAKEDTLNTIVLTPEAEDRLGLKLGAVAMKPVRRARIYGGDVTIPIGRTILVAAPLGGILRAAPDGTPKVGQTVKAGRPVFQLLPLLTPEGRTAMASALVDADGQVENARTSLDLAKIALDRAKRLLKEEAGSQRAVDERQAAFELATKTLDAVTARRNLLSKAVGEVDSGTAAPIPIDAPQDGMLRAVSAMPGQTVPSGAALFEVVDLSIVWVRTPVPVGDLDEIARGDDAGIGPLSAAVATKSRPAKSVAAPPSANPISATVDLFYELPNSDGRLIPGQRLGVTVSLADARESATVPWSAVVFDIHGGSWVYERTGPRTYVRRRVVVRYTVGSDAAIADGPATGTAIVVEGGQELFGAETGFSK